MKIIGLVLGILLFATTVRAVDVVAPMASQNCADAASCKLVGLNLKAVAVNWPVATTARFMYVFDATSLPSSGAVSSCNVSHVTGCYLDCEYSPHSTTAPNVDSFDYNLTPLAAKFGLIVAMSTGASCDTFTPDGANDFFTAQAR